MLLHVPAQSQSVKRYEALGPPSIWARPDSVNQQEALEGYAESVGDPLPI